MLHWSDNSPRSTGNATHRRVDRTNLEARYGRIRAEAVSGKQLEKHLRELQEQTLKAAIKVTVLQKRRRKSKGQAGNLDEASAKMRPSSTLLQQLTALESEIAKLDERLASAKNSIDLAFLLELVRDFVPTKVTDLRSALIWSLGRAADSGEPYRKLVLTPRKAEDGSVYAVSGDIDLFGGDLTAMSLAVKTFMSRQSEGKKSVVQVVARDGIAPPPPAFSGLPASCSK